MENLQQQTLNKNKFEFIKVPNSMFYEKVKDEITGNYSSIEGWFKDMNDNNIIMILTYLQTRVNWVDEVYFTIDELIKFCGQVPKNGKGKTRCKMKALLNNLKNKGIINTDIDFTTIKYSEIIKVKYDPINSIKDERWVRIPTNIINKISSIKNCDTKIALTLWSYLHCRRYIKNVNSIATKGERASSTTVSYDYIIRDTGFANDTIKKYNDILVNNGLLLKHNSGYLKKGKEIKECYNIYVTVDNTLEEAQAFMKEAVSMYEKDMKQKGYSIIHKTKEEKKSIRKNKRKTSPQSGVTHDEESPTDFDSNITYEEYTKIQEQEAEINNMLSKLF